MLGTAEGQAALEAEKLAILAEADAKEKLRAKLVSLNLDDDDDNVARSSGLGNGRSVRFGLVKNSGNSYSDDDDVDGEYDDDEEASDGVLVGGDVDEEIGFPVRKGPGDVTHRHRAARTAAAGGEMMAATRHRNSAGGPARRRHSAHTALGRGGSRTTTAATGGLFGGPSLREMWQLAVGSVGGVMVDSLGPRATVVRERARRAHHMCKSGAARAKKWVTLTLHGACESWFMHSGKTRVLPEKWCGFKEAVATFCRCFAQTWTTSELLHLNVLAVSLELYLFHN